MTELLRSFGRACAFISGGATGLGRALALSIAKHGGRVTVMDTNEEAGNSLSQELESYPNAVYFHGGSVTQIEDVRTALNHGLKHMGETWKLNLCVNCASKSDALRLFNKGRGRATSFERFWPIMSVNAVGSFNVLTSVVQFLEDSENVDSEASDSDISVSQKAEEVHYDVSTLKLRGLSRCVVINKTFLFEDFNLLTSYIASKGAVKSMTLPAARELSELGIRVCSLSTGFFETEKFEERFSPTLKETLVKNRLHPTRRFPQEEEFVHAVAAIFENELINGVDVKLDAINRFMNQN